MTHAINDLRIQRDFAAMESHVVSDVQQFLKNIFPSVMTGFAGVVNHFSPEAPAIALTSKQTDFINELAKHSYLDLAPLTSYVPEGLEVPYLEYSDELFNAVEHAASVLFKGLSAYSMYLSQVINNADIKYSTTTFASGYKDMAKHRELFNEKLGKCFGKGSTKAEVAYKEVIKRNADWPKVFKNCDDMTKRINSVDRKVLSKKINECTELLTIIGEKLQRGDFEGAYPQLAENLSDGAYQMASELQFYAVTYYKVDALVNSVNRTVERMKEIFHR